MKRNSTIASVAAATGIVGATVIAAISLMQATVSEDSDIGTVTLAASSATVPALEFTPEPLPEIPTISDAASPTSDSTVTTETPTGAALLGRDYAKKAVLNAAPGKVTEIDALTRDGVPTFAVTVKRTDGSIITGYVDRSSGDVYEWIVNQAAPAPITSYEDDDDDYEDDYDEDHDEDDDHDDDDDEEDERDEDDD
jgi:hypothetical protein